MLTLLQLLYKTTCALGPRLHSKAKRKVLNNITCCSSNLTHSAAYTKCISEQHTPRSQYRSARVSFARNTLQNFRRNSQYVRLDTYF